MLESNSAQDINLIANIARKMKINVLPVSESECEDIEDLHLLSRMKVARLEGLANREETLSKLGIEV
ncbi:MAG: hypothetical protein LBR64_00175 [Dysgonamonadaceae bacterium]|jgi:hypothetical protein|nr:hypothetical protein [Dysgonamonadaceae bacterium]